MKLNHLVAAAALLWTSASFACPHNAQQFMCPGDAVVDQDGTSGQVVGINPFQHTVSVFESSYNRNYTLDIKTLALGVGCLEGYCVGDKAVDQDGTNGSIVAVNPYTRSVVLFEPSYNRNYVLSIDTIAIGLGCMQGYCVGDGVVDQDGTNGTIVALNPVNHMVAVFEPSYNRNYVLNITSLSNTNFCATYGDHERQFPRYPVLSTSGYISVDLHFTLQR